MPETYHLINFSFGGNKKGNGDFFLESVRKPDKSIFRVLTLRHSPTTSKIKRNHVSILKLL